MKAAAYGFPPDSLYDYSPAELCDYIKAAQEREIVSLKHASIIAYQQAIMTGQLFSGKVGEIYEVFPFWTEDEIKAMKVEKYAQRMRKIAAKGRC